MQASGQAAQLTATNLKILTDQLNHEANSSKKCELFAQQISDAALKGMVMSLAQHHRTQYDKLLNYLNSHQ